MIYFCIGLFILWYSEMTEDYESLPNDIDFDGDEHPGR